MNKTTLKNFIFLMIFFFTNGIVHSQMYTSNFDVAAMVEGCEELPSAAEQVKCSESKLHSFFTAAVDHNFCPIEDTTRIYTVDFMVDNYGNINETKCRAYLAKDSCISFFKQKAEMFADQHAMSPAKKDRKRIASRKSFTFSYPPPHPEEKKSDDSVFKNPDEMPRFVGCEDIVGSAQDKNACGQNKLLQAIYSQLLYPAEARSKSVEGMVVVQFIIDTEGLINDPKIVRSVGSGCDEAVLDLMERINQMNPPFVPGKQDGEAVKVLYTLPVKFKLE